MKLKNNCLRTGAYILIDNLIQKTGKVGDYDQKI